MAIPFTLEEESDAESDKIRIAKILSDYGITSQESSEYYARKIVLNNITYEMLLKPSENDMVAFLKYFIMFEGNVKGYMENIFKTWTSFKPVFSFNETTFYIDDDTVEEIAKVLAECGVISLDTSKYFARKLALKNITVKKLLSIPRADMIAVLKCFIMFEEFGTEYMDNIFRVKKRSNINYEEKKIIDLSDPKSLSWEDIACIFEKRVKPKNKSQRSLWYEYLEDESIDGLFLLNQDCSELTNHFELNDAQKVRFEEILRIIKHKDKTNYGINVTTTGCNLQTLIIGSTDVNISNNRSRQMAN